jgi:hypothetical protein
VDARHKAGHDENWWKALFTELPQEAVEQRHSGNR